MPHKITNIYITVDFWSIKKLIDYYPFFRLHSNADFAESIPKLITAPVTKVAPNTIIGATPAVAVKAAMPAPAKIPASNPAKSSIIAKFVSQPL